MSATKKAPPGIYPNGARFKGDLCGIPLKSAGSVSSPPSTSEKNSGEVVA
jgi:hypothetical protein